MVCFRYIIVNTVHRNENIGMGEEVKVKQSRYRPGGAQWVPGS
jgi:hypothetical protein